MLYECGCRHLGVLEDYGPEFTAKATEELFRVKVDYHEPAKLHFHFLKTSLKKEWSHNKQELKVSAVNAWESISRVDSKTLKKSKDWGY